MFIFWFVCPTNVDFLNISANVQLITFRILILCLNLKLVIIYCFILLLQILLLNRNTVFRWKLLFQFHFLIQGHFNFVLMYNLIHIFFAVFWSFSFCVVVLLEYWWNILIPRWTYGQKFWIHVIFWYLYIFGASICLSACSLFFVQIWLS